MEHLDRTALPGGLIVNLEDTEIISAVTTIYSMDVNNRNEEYQRYANDYDKKMKKMKSIMKLIGKFARILVGIARNNEPYCPEKVQPLAA